MLARLPANHGRVGAHGPFIIRMRLALKGLEDCGGHRDVEDHEKTAHCTDKHVHSRPVVPLVADRHEESVQEQHDSDGHEDDAQLHGETNNWTLRAHAIHSQDIDVESEQGKQVQDASDWLLPLDCHHPQNAHLLRDGHHLAENATEEQECVAHRLPAMPVQHVVQQSQRRWPQQQHQEEGPCFRSTTGDASPVIPRLHSIFALRASDAGPTCSTSVTSLATLAAINVGGVAMTLEDRYLL
mmetsp:Transcript_45648/g.108684  ORF Transcript_45648/g.108684 Transcript_45648/m.108684 type:complete len:241 (+) Transcript_45648:1840-2562(+)